MPLTERRKDHREIMAQEIEALAKSLNVSCLRGEFDGPREISLHLVGARGLSLTVEFNGQTAQLKADTHVLSWHMATGAIDRLKPSFGGVNEYHFQKATWCAHGYGALCSMVQDGFTRALTGAAFQS